jgi:hypothetical protein
LYQLVHIGGRKDFNESSLSLSGKNTKHIKNIEKYTSEVKLVSKKS